MSTAERIRVLHIVPSFGVGGAEQMAGHLMLGLSESFEIGAVGLYPAVKSSIEVRLGRAGIPLWHLEKRQGFDARLYTRLDRLMQQARPHLVHTHLSVLRYALPALLRRRIPVLHTMHNLAEYESDGVGRVIQRFAFRCGVTPVGISREVAASVKRVYGRECPALVPNCIPVEAYRKNSSERVRWREREGFATDAVVFICVGRLEPQKNPLVMLRAFANLKEPGAHLVLVGDGSLREQVQGFIRAASLEERVHLLGRRPDIRECLSASDVFVLSSDWEGNPLSVMEAMAAGLPVVATTVGGVPELVESGIHGILTSPGDCAAFSNAMEILLKNRERRLRMAQAACLRAASEFNVPSMVAGYERLYNSILAKRSGFLRDRKAAVKASVLGAQ